MTRLSSPQLSRGAVDVATGEAAPVGAEAGVDVGRLVAATARGSHGCGRRSLRRAACALACRGQQNHGRDKRKPLHATAERGSKWISTHGCVSLSHEGKWHDHGSGDRTYNADASITVAGLCRTLTGFADPRSCLFSWLGKSSASDKSQISGETDDARCRCQPPEVTRLRLPAREVADVSRQVAHDHSTAASPAH